MKNAIDTLQLLELGSVGKCSECGHVFRGFVADRCPACGKRGTNTGTKNDRMAGSYKFSLTSAFMMYYGMIVISAILLFAPVLEVMYFALEDEHFIPIILQLTFTSIFLFAMGIEYYTCCKRKYRADLPVLRASITRCRWVSYIELDWPTERKP